MIQNEKKRYLESEVLRDLAKTLSPGRATEIYNEFVFNYKNKHLGDFDGTKKDSWDSWYDKRAETFYRFAHRHYIRGNKNG